MSVETVERRARLPVPVEDAFAWHSRPGALERLLSPWERVRVLERRGGLEDARATLRIGGLRVTLEHRDFVAGRQYRTVQTRGPFTRWDHLHRFEPEGPEASSLIERIEYALPGGPLGRALARGPLRRRIARALADRQRRVALDLAAHRASRTGPLRVLVSGASGLIGSALVPFLTTGGHTVVRLVRRAPRGPDEVAWDPESGAIDLARLEGFDAAVHLAGRSLDSGPWTRENKRRIRESRVAGTGLLARSLARLRQPPRVLVCASGVGAYGDRGDLELTEESSLGSGFLAELAREWEGAAEPAHAAGVRVVHSRNGVVLTPRGGALARLLPPFLLGAGGRLGSGRQWWSWISLDDLLGVILHAIARDEIAGPLNAVSPGAVTQAEFARALARALGRPALVPAPAFALRALLGPMADEVLLASQRARPARLEAAGFAFRDPALEPALRWMLGRSLDPGMA